MNSRSLLLDSASRFMIAKSENLCLNKDPDGMRLQKVPITLKDMTGSFGGLSLPTGIAVDDYGNVYFIDKEHALILKYDLCPIPPAAVQCVGGKGTELKEFDSPTGIAISSSGTVFISDTNNNRIQVFYIKGFVLKDVWGKVDEEGKPASGTRKGEFNNPWDLAIDSQKYVYIVDRGNNRIQKFSPDGDCIMTFGATRLDDPLHIAIDNNDVIYVMDSGLHIKTFASNGIFKEEIEHLAENEADFYPPRVTVDAAGRIHYKLIYPKIDFVLKQVFKVAKDPVADICTFSKKITLPGVYFENDMLIFASENVPDALVEEIPYVEEGCFFTDALDSSEYKCTWHKMYLDAVIPLGTSVTVQTHTSETKKDFQEIQQLDDAFWQTNQKNPTDFLVQSPPGRYLWLKVILKGNNRQTPIVKGIKVHYPRSTYLEYLPGIYQADPASKLFLEQFLSIFEHFFEEIEEEIDNITRYFNPAAVPEKFLPWLASWLALTMNDKWSLEKKRLLIQQASELFKKRGTLPGMQDILKIFTGRMFHILEHFRIRRKYLILSHNSIFNCNTILWGMDSLLGVNTELADFSLGDSEEPIYNPFQSHAHEFSIFIPSKFLKSEEDERMIKRVIDLWKPAHTRYYLCSIEPRFRIGLQSMIGVNTIIGQFSDIVLAQSATLGREIILAQDIEDRNPPGFRLGKDVRIDNETIII